MLVISKEFMLLSKVMARIMSSYFSTSVVLLMSLLSVAQTGWVNGTQH